MVSQLPGACADYSSSTAYDANPDRMANPVYELLPRGLERVRNGTCMSIDSFRPEPTPRRYQRLAAVYDTSRQGAPRCCQSAMLPECPYLGAQPDSTVTLC